MSNLFCIPTFYFAQPYFLIGLLVLPFVLWCKYKTQLNTALLISSTSFLPATKPSLKIKILKSLPIIQALAIALLIIALARPQQQNATESSSGSGIDIMLSLDISGSMLAQDFTPNRLQVAKNVLTDFITSRPYDRIGLVIFSGESYTQCPLTTDHQLLLQQLQGVQSGMLKDGTAIGMGLATAVERMKASTAKSKIIILLTDGVNNMGLIDPATALEIAKALGTKVYTIGVGTIGTAPMPIGKNAFGEWVFGNEKVEIDEVLLNKIASETAGKYYRAADNTALQKVYKEIDKLEKSKIDINKHVHTKELFFPLVLFGFWILIIVFIVQHTYLRTAV
jgi:Ca-activated chloride channel homolog